MSANFWFSNLWLAGAPPSPLRTPNQSEGQWSRKWKKVRWCAYFKWCHRAFPLYVLKVVSSVPYWRWFGYTLTHSSMVNLLSPNHLPIMGSPHGPQLTHLLSHILLGFFFFVVLIILISILSLDHFACKMGLLTSSIYKQFQKFQRKKL
jgi:hypothetical protein